MTPPPSPEDRVLLSRFLDGDLDEDERRDLLQRLESEPALAAALAQAEAVLADLAGLSPTLPPPAHLAVPTADAPPTTRTTAPTRPVPLPWVLAGAAAAAALLLALRPTPAATIVTDADGAVLDGRIDLNLASGHSLELDGRGRIATTPPDPEAPVLRHPLAAAAGGALLTVAIYEGSALLRGPDGAVELQAGDSRTVDVDTPAPQRVVRVADGPAPASGAPAGAATSTEEELARLRAENEALRFENALVKGNLTAHEGQPMAWPDDLPERLRPDGFAAMVEAAVADVEGVELVEVDCAEFPCIGVLRSTEAGPGWEEQASAVPKGLAADLGEDYGAMVMARGEDDGTGPVMLMGFALMPPGVDPQESGPRTGYRAEEAMTAISESLRDEQAAAGD